MNSSAVHLYHIAYSQETLELLRPGFRVLDNLSNPRADWYESWPIREFLLQNKLDEDAYYGFFSPKFYMKTGLDANDIKQFISTEQEPVDAFFVCPQAEVGAVFLNPVMGSEFTDPGALATVQQVMDKAGLGLDIASQVIDSTTLVYSNYVIAKPSYWRRWLSLVEFIYQLADAGSDPQLQEQLKTITNYGGNVQRKVFLIECLASMLFISERMKVKSIPVNQNLAGRGVMYPYRNQAQICDALKIAFNRTGDQSFLQAFQEKSQEILNNFLKPAASDVAAQKLPDNVNESYELSKAGHHNITNKHIILVVATRYSEAEFHAVSATGRSLQMFQFPNVTLRLFPNNSMGLPELYNAVIQEFESQDVHLVFAHDDLHFLDLFWPTHIQQGLAQYDLVGIVGNKTRHPLQPSWAFIDINGTWDQKENLSGSVAHGRNYPPETCAEFGPTGPVKVLDGLLLAASSRVFKQTGLRFDEQFSFHFYDLDLCRQVEQLQLRAGTIPFSVMHESKGSYNNQSWLDAYKAYIAKWRS